MKPIVAILSLLLMPIIWFLLLYKILESINASELMWFLYWAYLPVAFLSGLILRLAKD